MRPRKWTLITGASTGIGYHFAAHCAQRGENLLLVSRSAERLQQAVAALKQQFAVQIFALPYDLTLPDAVDQVLRWLEAVGEFPDFIIHNAGFGAFGEFSHLSEQTIEQQIAIHATFPLRFTRAILPRLLEMERATILFVASTAAFAPVPYLAVYGAAKALELHAALGLRYELARTNVRVCCCCPGPVATGFFATAAMPQHPPFPLRLMQPEAVVRYTLRQVERNKAVIVPGFWNRWIARFSQILPKTLTARIAAALYRRQLSQTKQR